MHIFGAPLLVMVLIFVLLVIVGSIFQSAKHAPKTESNIVTNGPAYEAVPSLLTPAERSFFGVLQQALASDYQIFTKVRLADIVRPVRNPSRSGWQSAFNRTTGKHVDFVLCHLERLNVVGVIELDDSTHERFERGIRDSLVDSALAEAGIPVLRVPTRQAYSPAQIRDQVQSLFRSNDRVARKAI